MSSIRHKFTRTKIVCTLGPAVNSPARIAAMIKAGMDVARINASHGTLAQHKATLSMVRRVAGAAKFPLAVILDLQGPKIRIGELTTPLIELCAHNHVTITTRSLRGTCDLLPTTYHHLPKDVKPGDRILLDDGKVELSVEAVRGQDVRCRVVTGGTLSPHKGMNLPGVRLSTPSLTDKDKEDMQFAFSHDVDYVALSFVRTAHDVASLRDYIIENGPKGRKIPIIAKIEKPEAILNIDEVIAETDAVMVARGDLGVEMPTEDVPLLQKMIVRKCNELGKPVIIATQMLESMITHPRPTRAEASDVANAVLDGADAVMLSGETSVGQYPIEAITVMDRIIRKTEEQRASREQFNPDRIASTHAYDPLARSACALADYIGSSVIVTITYSGVTAAQVAKFRPPSRIIGVTDREKILRRLNLIWGVRGMTVENLKKDTDVTFKMIQKKLLKEGYVKKGDIIVMMAGLPLFEGHPTNTIKVVTA